jgi:hypothetical protein
MQMKFFILIFSLLPILVNSQDKIPKKANTIEISGVAFRQVADALLDAGFTFEKIDSNFLTIKTDFKEGTGKNKWMKLRLLTRVKDSAVFISGEWYNTMFIGGKLLGVEQTVENSTYKIEYTSGNPKACFLEMNEFANIFKKPKQFLIK